MPVTPDMARDIRGQGAANNRGQAQSQSRGRDTIGKGSTVLLSEGHGGPLIVAGKTEVKQTEKPMGFDKRSNTVHGEPKEQPYCEEYGARLVGDTMLRQEPIGRSKHQQDDDVLVGNAKDAKTGRPGAVQFTIEDGNHAKTIR